MFEHHSQPIATLPDFLERLVKAFLLGAAIVGISLLAGTAGYRNLEGMPWLDSLLNASMILGGMGPVDPLRTASEKLFASIYALYSGLAFVAVAGILMGPVLHRLLHAFHRAP